MSGVHQLLVAAAPSDAITALAFELRTELRHSGPSEVYARYIAPELTGDVKPLASLGPDQAVVYHAAIGEPEVAEHLGRHRGALGLIFHNISPPDAFLPYDRAFATRLAQGLSELKALIGRADLAIAVSEYNGRELRGLGFSRVEVFPLASDPTRLLRLASDRDADVHWSTAAQGPLILFVGQALPHKRPEQLIAAYHVAVTYLGVDAHLVLAGPQRLPAFSHGLQYLIEELNLAKVSLAGPVSDAVLATLYRRAQLFVTLSDHEGLCVPILEAMAFGVPVLAKSRAAIPETARGAALLLPGNAGATLVAEAMARVLHDTDLRERLVSAGHKRVRGIDVKAVRSAAAARLLTLL